MEYWQAGMLIGSLLAALTCFGKASLVNYKLETRWPGFHEKVDNYRRRFR